MEALDLIVDEGRPANAGRFFQLGADLLALLDELSDVPVAWRVQDLRSGSAIARIAPPESEPEQAQWLGAAVRSLRSVEASHSVPTEWTPDAVKVAHRFVEHGQAQDDELNWVAPRLVLVGGTDVEGIALTPTLGDRLADLQPFERTMPGSVRGTLVGLNVSRGNRASLRGPTGRVVRIAFDGSLRLALKDALYQPIELRGVVRQDGDGRVFHVKADEVTVLSTEAGRWADLFGAAPDFTGGLPVDDFLEANRGEA